MTRYVPPGAPVARAKRGSPERGVQVTLVKWLETVLPIGSVVFAVKNESAAKATSKIARARFFAKRKAEGVRTGFPDIGICLPHGAMVMIETKAPNGVVSDAQQGMHDRLRALGHVVILATSIETCRAGLQAAGVLLRETAGQLAVEPVVRMAKRRARLPADGLPF